MSSSLCINILLTQTTKIFVEISVVVSSFSVSPLFLRELTGPLHPPKTKKKEKKNVAAAPLAVSADSTSNELAL